MKKILVTGATGFIGTHLVPRLLTEDYEVTVFVRDRQKLDADIRGKIRVFEGDILCRKELKNIPADIDTVIHLAAAFPDDTQINNNCDDTVYNVNVEGTRNILEAVNSENLKSFILASSISVYDGLLTTECIDEGTRTCPDNVYGHSKVEAENILRKASEIYGFKAMILRMPFVYGPGNKRNIYRMIRAVDRGRFYMIGRGENRRSALYVGNLVEAMLLALINDKAKGGIYIVTDKKKYALIDLYRAIAEALGKKPSKIFIPSKFAGVCARCADILEEVTGRTIGFNSDIYKRITRTFCFSCEKICRELGYRPEVDFYSTIKDTVNWYKDLQKTVNKR